MAQINLDWIVTGQQEAASSFDAQVRAARILRRELELLARIQRQTGQNPIPRGAARDADQFARSARRAARATEDLGDAAGMANNAVSEFLSNLASGVAYGIADRGLQLVIDAVQGLISGTVEFGISSVRVADQSRALDRALTAVLGSTEAASQSLDDIEQIALNTGGNIETLANGFVTLSGASQGTSLSIEEITQFTENAARGFSIFGLEAERQQSVLTQLAQSLGRGKIQMEELSIILENFPAARGIIQAGLGVESLNEALDGGQFSADTFFRAFSEGLAQVQGDIDPSTLAVSRLNNSIRETQIALGNALRPLRDAGAGGLSEIIGAAQAEVDMSGLAIATEGFRDRLAENPEVLQTIGEAIGQISNILLEDVADGLTGISNWLVENEDDIGNFLDEIVIVTDGVSTAIGELLNILGLVPNLIDAIVDGVLNLADNTGISFLNDQVLRLIDGISTLITGTELFGQEMRRLNVPELQELGDGLLSTLNGINQLSGSVGQISSTTTQSLAEQVRVSEQAADEIERQRDVARELAEIEFREQQGRGQLAERRQAQDEARAFQADQAQQQADLEDQLRSQTERFNRQEEARQQENEERLQVYREEGARIIEGIQSRAAERINQLNEDAQNRLQARQQQGQEEINQLRTDIERELELEAAGSSRERRELERRFEEEDEIAQRRFEAFEPVREAERELEEDLAQIREDSETEIEGVRLQTEQNVAAFRQGLQEAEQEFRLQQEEELAGRRQALEVQQAQLRQDLETQLQSEALAFTRQQENERFQAQLDRQAQQREFQAEQRRLDEESAERIEQITSNVGTPSVPAFKDGGIAPGGVALVGEAGPEIVSLPKGSNVISNAQSTAIARQALEQNPALANPFIGSLASAGIQNNLLLSSASSPQISTTQMESLLFQIATNTTPMMSAPSPYSEILRRRRG